LDWIARGKNALLVIHDLNFAVTAAEIDGDLAVVELKRKVFKG
jgi:hypothetical protein